MALVELTRLVADRPGRPDLGELARRMRDLTLAIATDDSTWTKERAAEVSGFFDSMASGWRGHDAPERHEALADGLARGGPFPTGWCVEIGSGTGNATPDLRTAFPDVMSTDISLEMLRLAPFADRRGHLGRHHRTGGLGNVAHRPKATRLADVGVRSRLGIVPASCGPSREADQDADRGATDSHDVIAPRELTANRESADEIGGIRTGGGEEPAAHPGTRPHPFDEERTADQGVAVAHGPQQEARCRIARRSL